MMRIVTVVATSLMIMVLFGCKPQQHNPEAENAGLVAAREWIKDVDAHLYQQSWQDAAVLFRDRVSQDEWRHTLQQIREPLGAVESRDLLSTRYTTSVKQGPEGEYVIVEFTVRFGNGKKTVETVTPMKEADGQWRVVGYSMEK